MRYCLANFDLELIANFEVRDDFLNEKVLALILFDSQFGWHLLTSRVACAKQTEVANVHLVRVKFFAGEIRYQSNESTGKIAPGFEAIVPQIIISW